MEQPDLEEGTLPFSRRFADAVLESPTRLLAITLLCSLPLLAYILVDLPLRAQIAMSCVVVAICLVVVRRFPEYRLVIVMLSVATSARYILYRGTETLHLAGAASLGDVIVSLMLYGAELYAAITLVGGYFQTAIIRRNRPIPLEEFDEELPSVDVYIPTYNEDLSVLRPTVLGAMAMDYPNKEVWVLDDGRRDHVREMAAQLGVHYIRRENNQGAKAGNLNNALDQTRGDLIAIFDADHVPVRGFLQSTVGFFLRDLRLALVQTPHHFYNPDPFQRNLDLEGSVPPEGHFFYHAVQLGNDFWNSSFFCGSCAIIKRSALDLTDGIRHETVTEDAHTALQLHSYGYNSLFLDIPLAAGLATETFAFHIGQRIRWARGMAQIFRIDNPLLKPGLTMAQRINYFNATWHFLFGIPRMIFIITPPLYLLFDFHPLNADVREVMVFAVPHLLLEGMGASTAHRNVRHSFWPEVYEVALAPYAALVTTMALIAPGRGSFNVTAKGAKIESTTFDLRHALPLLVLLGVNVVGLAVLPSRVSAEPEHWVTIATAGAWSVYNLFIVSAAVSAAVERTQRRDHHRITQRLPVVVGPITEEEGELFDDFEPVQGSTTDLSMGGLALELLGRHELPPVLNISLVAPGGDRLDITLDVLGTTIGDTHTLIRGRFRALDIEELSLLNACIFSPTAAWLTERFVYDKPWHSLLHVLLVPLKVALGSPRWLRGVERWISKGERGGLVPESEQARCSTCDSPLVVGPTHCEGCGAPSSLASTDAPARLAPTGGRSGLAPMISPALMFALAISLVVGWDPVVEQFAELVPSSHWEQVTVSDRQVELRSAADAIREHYTVLLQGEAVDEAWVENLWEIRRSHRIYGYEGHRRETARAEALLYSILLSMASAAESGQRGDPGVEQWIRDIDQDLSQLDQLLGVGEA